MILAARRPAARAAARGELVEQQRARRAPGRLARHLRTEGFLVFALAVVSYLIVAVLLNYKYDVVTGDASSRMANAFYVLYSRDPHVAAIGFVWNPLPSFIDMFFLLFKDIWPALATRDMAGSLMSVFSMAGAVYQSDRILREWRISGVGRSVVLIAIALNPMVVLYGGNGMSEALYIFTLVATTRYLLRWLRGEQPLRSLVYAGSFLGLAYLARNEVVGSTAVAVLLVFGVSFARGVGRVRRDRTLAALTDATIVLAPFFVTFTGWAVTSYVITKSAFPQFQSQYGNSAQVGVGLERSRMVERGLHELHQLLYMAPEIPLVAVVLIGLLATRRDVELLAPVAVLGGSLAFSMVGYLDGTVFPWFRFFILAVPLCALVIGGALRPRTIPSLGSPRRRASIAWQVALAAAAAVALLPSLVSTGVGMLRVPDPLNLTSVNNIGTENLSIEFIFHDHLTNSDESSIATYPKILSIGDYFTSRHLPDGDIVVDTFDLCVPEIYTTIANPKIFVITNDRDFQQVLADPLRFGAHYILVPDPTGLGSLDATNAAYPTLYASGGGFATLAHQFHPAGLCPAFRLYRVNKEFLGV